ncbi:MAG: AAA family ATPase [Candidatus Anstonellales archaeon]
MGNATTQVEMQRQLVGSYIKTVQKSEWLGVFFMFFLAGLFLYSAVPYYHLILVVALALVVGALAVKNALIATLALYILAAPSFIYQSSGWGWIYLLALSLVFFKYSTHWDIIIVLTMIICSAFAQFPFSLLAPLTYLVIAGSALYFGSKKAALIAAPSVFLIILLSGMWQLENNLLIPFNPNAYTHSGALQFGKAPDIQKMGEVTGRIGAQFSLQGAIELNNAIGVMAGNIVNFFIKDIGIFHLALWIAVLFAIAIVPTYVKKFGEATASLALLAIPLLYAGLWAAKLIPSFNFLLFGYAVVPFLILLALNYFGVSISRERELRAEDRMRSFGKLGIQKYSIKEKGLDDIGGYEDVKEELRKAIMTPLEYKQKAELYGIKPPTGVLLFGPPGTGKTMLMRALAAELKYNFIQVNTAELISKYVGETEKNIAELFEEARKSAPTIIFFDEIDTIGRKRESGGDSTSAYMANVLNAFLQEMDGFVKSGKPVVVVAATNRPDILDPALTRPGRFDRIIYMRLPNAEERAKIFEVHLRGLLIGDINYELLGSKTPRFSGADIKFVVDEAKKEVAERAIKTGKDMPITTEDLLKIIALVKPSATLTMLEKYEQFGKEFERRIGKVEEKKVKKVRWEDVAGMEEVKNSIREAIELPLLHEEKMKEYGIKPYKGILLFGPPGCGKTLIVKAATSEMDVAFYYTSGAELVERGMVNGLAQIKDIFARAREAHPAIIFIDEIDTIASVRSGGGLDMVSQLLVEMDGIRESKGVLVMGATNRPEILDPALLRPGRFDKVVYVPPPDKKTREQIFRINLEKIKGEIDFDRLAEITDGFSGADIAAVAQEAKMLALRSELRGQRMEVSTQLIENIIKSRRSSISPRMLETYEAFLRIYGERK